MRIVLIILLFILVCFITFIMVYMYRKPEEFKRNEMGEFERNKMKGIVYFDIDGTLTNAKTQDIESNVQICLDNNYGVGIITASSREIKDMCNLDKSVISWMPNNLCKYMKDTDYKTFNTSHIVAGMKPNNKNYPKNFPPLENNVNLKYGVKKGYQMIYGQKLFDIKNPRQIVLFDDDPSFITGAKKYNPRGTIICAGNACNGLCNRGPDCQDCTGEYMNNSGSLHLNNKIVRDVISSLKK